MNREWQEIFTNLARPGSAVVYLLFNELLCTFVGIFVGNINFIDMNMQNSQPKGAVDYFSPELKFMILVMDSSFFHSSVYGSDTEMDRGGDVF